MKHVIFFLCLCGIAWGYPLPASAEWLENHHRVGAGVHYWTSIEDIIIDDADEDGLAFMLSYQYQMQNFLTLETDLEFMREGYAGATESVVAPQIYALLGRGIYAGIGMGMNYTDGKWGEHPFWALRGGLDLEVLPSIFLDLNINYRSEKWDLDTIDEEIRLKTLTVGGILRFEFE